MNFLRLIRPINLLIIAFTMYSTRVFLYVYEHFFETQLFAKEGESFDFFLLVFSTILIAAAGNIINDYFDVKADRINKPEKLIITKYITRRWAIMSHWILNGIAFSIAVYLSVKNQTFWYVFIHLLSINSLWFYSMSFKRKLLIGNITIAFLTALVPVLCGVHFYIQSQFPSGEIQETATPISYWIYHLLNHGHYIFILAFFAFTTNLAREIIKDIEDIEGDKVLHARTLPIIYGAQKSKLIAGIILFLSPIFFIILFLLKLKADGLFFQNLLIFSPVVISLFLNLVSALLLVKSVTRKELKTVELFVKLAMFMGLLLPFYWILLS